MPGSRCDCLAATFHRSPECRKTKISASPDPPARKSVKAKHIFFRRDRQFLPFELFHRIAAQMGGTSFPSMRLLKVMGSATKLTGRSPVHESRSEERRVGKE